MRVFARKTLREFWNNHSDSEDALKAWFSEAESSQWESPSDIKNEYPHASILPDNRVVFNIKGNNYRLVVKINYDYGQDRKSTRLNSSHVAISYAVFCLKKKIKQQPVK